MKKTYLSSIALSTIIFFSSCSSCTKSTREKEEGLPKNPTQGQVYVDNSGHSWVYDAILMRWALGGGSLGGGTTNYYYYPSTGRYEDNTGKQVTPPSKITSQTSETQKSKVSATGSTSTNKISTNKSKPTEKKSIFGKTGRSKSISA